MHHLKPDNSNASVPFVRFTRSSMQSMSHHLLYCCNFILLYYFRCQPHVTFWNNVLFAFGIWTCETTYLHATISRLDEMSGCRGIFLTWFWFFRWITVERCRDFRDRFSSRGQFDGVGFVAEQQVTAMSLLIVDNNITRLSVFSFRYNAPFKPTIQQWVAKLSNTSDIIGMAKINVTPIYQTIQMVWWDLMAVLSRSHLSHFCSSNWLNGFGCMTRKGWILNELEYIVK